MCHPCTGILCFFVAGGLADRGGGGGLGGLGDGGGGGDIGGDQIVENNGADMTCSAHAHQLMLVFGGLWS